MKFMAHINNRFAISLLGKERKSDAVNTEVIIDKETGEIQVKTASGKVISYNYNARFTEHVNTFTFNSYNADIYGTLYDVEIDALDLPAVVQKSTNLLDSAIPLTTKAFKSFMISIDLEAIHNDEKLSKWDSAEVPIELILEYTDGNTTRTKTITDRLYVINRMKFSSNEFGANSQPKLKSIKIGTSSSFQGDEKFILHSILVNVE